MQDPGSEQEFQLIPAIDLRGGGVVRLERGDFTRETSFSTDPARVARNFVAGGARWLHVVDLDGARTGTPAHVDVVREIVKAVGSTASVEVAGGLRSGDSVAGAVALGAARIVVGTRAIGEPEFAGDLVERHGQDRIAVALDVRDGLAVGQGWVSGAAGMPVERAVAGLLDVGVVWIEVTAIARDGMLTGPDLALLELALIDPRARVIASGGIATVDHLRAVRDIGCSGAIIGRALYDGTLSLEDALAAVRADRRPLDQ